MSRPLSLTAALLLLAACGSPSSAPPPAPASPAAPAQKSAPSAAAAPAAPSAPATPSAKAAARPPAPPIDAAASAALTSQAATAVSKLSVRKGVGRLPFEEAVLGNGLRVISLEDHSTPIVAVQLWYHVGSKDEQVDRQGFAHMFEHMMFRGTDRLGPKDHFEYVRRTGGNCNAFTAFDNTTYVNELPSNQLEMLLWLESERMAKLKIDEGGFDTERKVVEEERRLGLNQPYGDVLEKLLAQLFSQHPYRWSPIGQIEHLRASTPDDIQKFWDTYYVPNNCTLVVAGDVTHEQVRTLAQKCFGWIPRCPDPPRVTALEPDQHGERKVEIQPANGPVPIAGIVFRAVPEGDPDAVPLDMLMQVLGGGESSRVYIDLVRRKEVAIAGLAAYAGLEQAGFAAVVGITKPPLMGGKTGPVVDALWEQVDKIVAEGVTPEELAKVKKQARRADVTGTMEVAEKASRLGQAATIWGDAQKANERIQLIEAVTAEDLQRVAKTYLTRERATEMRIEPSMISMLKGLASAASLGDKPEADKSEGGEEVEGGARATASGPKAAAQPPAGYPPAPPVAPPLATTIDIHGVERTLDNGLRLVVVENHEVPFVSTSLNLTAGSFTEDPAHPGTAWMAANMVTRGTVARDAEALALELERNGISLNAGADHDAASVSVSSLTEDTERALRLLSEVVQAPRFDEKEFRTLRDQTATGMAIAEKTPSVIADRAFDKALWGDHPYARPAEGTSKDLAGLAPASLRAWWERWVRPDTATLYVSGDVTPDEAQRIAGRYLGAWESEGDVTPAPLPAVAPSTETRITLVDRPGAIQSEIRAGHLGITRDNPLYPTGVVLSQVFGGAFSSRLNDSLRVQKGLTYGARGGLSSSRFGGVFEASTFTKTPKTGETVRALVAEIERMRDEPPSSKELSDAVSYVSGSFAGSLETPQAMADRLWTLRINNLPAGWWQDYMQRIVSTRIDDVQEAARDLLAPEKLRIVVVGDAEAVKAELEEIAPVDVISEKEGG
jgi:zinc protease